MLKSEEGLLGEKDEDTVWRDESAIACYNCGKIYPVRFSHKIQEQNYCDLCYEELFEKCDYCHKYYQKKEIKALEIDYENWVDICLSCYELNKHSEKRLIIIGDILSAQKDVELNNKLFPLVHNYQIKKESEINVEHYVFDKNAILLAALKVDGITYWAWYSKGKWLKESAYIMEPNMERAIDNA